MARLTFFFLQWEWGGKLKTILAFQEEVRFVDIVVKYFD